MNFKERKSNNRFDVLKRSTQEISFRPAGKKKTRTKQKKGKEENDYYIPEEFVNNEQHNTFQKKKKNNEKEKEKINLTVNDKAFPTLGSNKTQQTQQNKQNKQNKQMNFLAVAKQEQKVEVIIDPKSVEPGWVKLWKNGNDGIIYSKYGLPTKWRLDEYLRDEEDFKIVSKQILTQWQNERDEITELLGDRSPYYNTPSLLEYLPEEDDEYYVKFKSDDSEEES